MTSFIGGFIVGSQKSRKILVRAIGPSLADFGLVALADPKLSLYDAAGVLLAANDNWKDTQETEIFNTGLAPSNLLESGIVITLAPGSYTAIVQGQNVSAGGVGVTTGTALVEIYDLDTTATLLNISARGAIQGLATPMITGFIIGVGPDNIILIRANGPSLDNFGLSGLSDPRLDLFDAEGNLLASNDNWQDSQASEIAATGLAPSDPLEAAILMTLPRGGYTAILSATSDHDRGTALAEVYRLD